VLSCSPLDPKFAGSNPAEDNGFLSVIKISWLPLKGKQSYRSHAMNSYRMLKKPRSVKKILL
jgi:hypothetical protein